MREFMDCAVLAAVGAGSSNVAAANLLLDWQPLMWKEDQSKDGGTQPTRRKRATHTSGGAKKYTEETLERERERERDSRRRERRTFSL